MAWENWPSSERAEGSPMDVVFHNKWRNRLDALRNRNAIPMKLDETFSVGSTDGNSFHDLNSQYEYWIPPYARYLILNLYFAIEWSGGGTSTTATVRASMAGLTSTYVSITLSTIPGEDGLLPGASQQLFHVTPIWPGSVLFPQTMSEALWGTTQTLKIQVRPGTTNPPNQLSLRVKNDDDFPWIWGATTQIGGLGKFASL